MRVFLVRHGQTDANLSGVFCGGSDMALNAAGEAQIRRVAEWLAAVKFDGAVSSALRRARRSAEIVLGARELPLMQDAALNEMHFGDWEMRHHRDLLREDAEAWRAWLDDWQRARPSGGESFPEFSARVAVAARRLLEQEDDGQRLIVAHQGVLSLLLANLLAMPAAAMWHFPFLQGAYSVLDIRDGFVALRAFNGQTDWHTQQQEH